MTFRLARAVAAWSVFGSLWVAAAACNSGKPEAPAVASSTVPVAAAPVRAAPAGPGTAPAVAATRPTTRTTPVAEATDPAARATTQPTTRRSTDESLHDAVTYLASDELEGRGIGTRGIDLAAEYIADRFRAAGLQPLPGLDGYFQPFPMTLGVSLGDGNALASGDRTFTFDADFRPFSFSAPGRLSGPLVFAGFGIAAADEHKYDDYAGLDVRGKVVLAMRFEPHNADGKSRFGTDSYTDHATFRRKAEVAAERGAAALLVVTPPTYHADDGLVPFVDGFVGGSAEIPVVQVTQAVAGELLARAGAPDLKTLQARIDETGRPDSRPLDGVTVSGTVDVRPTTTTVKNVAAVLPGSGPRADEYVVVGAHYDHLGRRGQMGPPEQRRDIHNGADDNASGTAAVLELAERFARSGPHQRSLVFIAFTAEEQGLIGSQRFVKHPPVPLDRIVAMVNLDMVGRVRQATLYVGGAGTAAGLQDVLNRADAASQLDLKDIGKGGLGPSDHMSFAVKRIPVLFFFTGLHAEYHRPGDDADLINYAGLRAVVDLTEAVVGDIIDMPRQEYVAASDASSAFRVGSPGSTMKVTLGVVPNYGAGEPGGAGSGVLIDGTVPGSPAADAGLRAGDVITSLGERRIRDIYDLTAALGDRKPGDRVAVQVRRDGQDVTLGATLAARGAASPSTASPHGPDPHAAPAVTQPTTTEATKKG